MLSVRILPVFRLRVNHGLQSLQAFFIRPNVEVVIDDLHVRDSGTPEEISTSFTTAKGDKGASGAKFNSMTTDEVITTSMRVQRNDQTLSQCIAKMLYSFREHGVQDSSIILDRGYSFEVLMASCIKINRLH